MKISQQNESWRSKMPFVALDLLGFKSVIKNNALNEVLRIYRQFLIETKTSLAFRKMKDYLIKTQLVSDSFFLYVEEGQKDITLREHTIREMIKCLSHLLYRSIISFSQKQNHPRVPIRAAFTLGEYYGDENFPDALEYNLPLNEFYHTFSRVVVGEAAVRAHEWEECQKWVGASFDPNTTDIMRTDEDTAVLLDFLKEDKLIIEYDVPTKDGLITTYAINFNIEGEFELLYNSLLFAEKMFEDNRELLAKYKGTKNFLIHCNENNCIRPFSDMLQ
ncbi:MAG: hypothetical protein FWD67_04965 [Betaproteobacteria bacterium]|nr:hypothetical protein [Betaproteobacteria bacterium]